jgi:two-component system phosphate regulon sensor histidine kinase PhoR
MIRPQRYFPWKIARQIYFGHFAFVVIVLIITGFSLHYFAYNEFLGGEDIHVALDRFDTYLTSLLLSVLVGCAIYLVFSTRYYTRPLGRLIQRARELRRLDTPIEEIEGDELFEEPGEWYDLERSLNRIHKELVTKTEALSREREELSALIGAVSDAILAIDRNGNPLFFNSQFAVIFEVGKSGGPKTLSLSEMFRVPDILQGYRGVLETGVMQTVNASIHTPQYPLPRYFSISIAPLRERDGEPAYGALGIFHDVTELKQAEQIRIEFVGNASHELRTPLTSIKGYVETVRDDLKKERFADAGKFLDIISRNVDRLIHLVNDLLDLSTLESGAELKRVNVSTREITDAALKPLETKRAAKSQEINIHYLTESLIADPRRVEQVLLNLVHNAIKYIPEGKRIDVYWENDNDGTVLRVKDNGPGIPSEHHSRLFERFYRVDAGRSRDQGGTGLGLAIVKHIMIKHGGSVKLTSRSGDGTEFSCTFPDHAID